MAIDPKAYGLELQTRAAPAEKPFEEVDGLALVHIEGPLVQQPHPFWQDYETIEASARAAFASSAEKVGLCIDSPGGMASGCFELTRALRAMAEESGKLLGVFIKGQACSAAYSIACAATAGICAPPTSIVGNVGVFEAIVDATVADAQLGLQFTFLVSEDADLKLAGNPHVPTTDAVKAHAQAQVNILTGLFYEVLSEMRGVAPEQARALRGAALLASQGAEKGLVDSVGTYGDFIAQLAKGNLMPPKTAQAAAPVAQAAKATDEEYAALRTLAESDDPEKKKLAKKMFATMLGEDDKDGDGDAGKDTDKDGARKAEGKDGEEGKQAAAAAPAAMALAATPDAVALAQRVHALETERALERDASKRAELLAKRPDFSEQVRATLASASLEVIEKAVATWPRVAVSPQAAAAAATPGVTPGQHDNVQKTVSPVEQQLLDRIGRSQGPTAKAARSEGTSFVLEPMTAEAATARLRQMNEQGLAPKGVGVDFARVSNTEFKVKA